MARSRINRLSPTLPPSASSASAMARPHQSHANVVERGGYRRKRLVNRYPHGTHEWKIGKECVGNAPGSGFDQTEALRTERVARRADDLVIGHGIHDLVR